MSSVHWREFSQVWRTKPMPSGTEGLSAQLPEIMKADPMRKRAGLHEEATRCGVHLILSTESRTEALCSGGRWSSIDMSVPFLWVGSVQAPIHFATRWLPRKAL